MKLKFPLIFAVAALCGTSVVHAASFMGNAERGRMVFTQRCAMCHGDDGKGRDGMAPDLLAEWHRMAKPDDELARNIRTGQQTSSKMYSGGPPPALNLTDRDMDDVLAYIRNAFGAGVSQFNTPQPGQPPFGQPGQPSFGQPPFGQPGQPSFGQPPFGQPPFGQPQPRIGR